MRGAGTGENELATAIIGTAIEVHRAVGPGLLESTYQQCLARELGIRAIPLAQAVPVSMEYKGLRIEAAYRVDFVGDSKVVVELKVADGIDDAHKAQLLTYLRWTGCRLGLLLQFGGHHEKRHRPGGAPALTSPRTLRFFAYSAIQV